MLVWSPASYKDKDKDSKLVKGNKPCKMLRNTKAKGKQWQQALRTLHPHTGHNGNTQAAFLAM